MGWDSGKVDLEATLQGHRTGGDPADGEPVPGDPEDGRPVGPEDLVGDTQFEEGAPFTEEDGQVTAAGSRPSGHGSFVAQHVDLATFRTGDRGAL
jgi:hypothetical protein